MAVDVTEAELRLFTARMANLRARIEEALARARNLRALGLEY